MTSILKTLFIDNPYIPEQVCAFCSQRPEFLEAERNYGLQLENLEKRLGQAEAAAFDEALSWYLAQNVHAYYLFGLGIRQDVLSALN